MAIRPGLVLAVFAGSGTLWGLYLASLPAARHAAGADDATLGAALLVSAVAAVPAMLLAGRLLDRFGRPAALATMMLFAAVAPLSALVSSVPGLVLALGSFGFCAGACDVVAVSLAVAAEAGSGKRVMNRAHALLSVGVLAGSALHALSLLVSAVLLLAAPMLWRSLPQRVVRRGGRRDRIRLGRPAALLCLLAALAMVVGSGVQSWSAVFLTDVVRADGGLAALAPGVFAGAMALGRFGGHWLSGWLRDRVVLLGSGVLSIVGVLLLASARLPVQGLAGTAVVGAAVSVAIPTAYARIGRGTPASRRGEVLGSAASIASTGLLAGPALVGQLAGLLGLRLAVAALCVLSMAVCLLALRSGNGDKTWLAARKDSAERTSSTAGRPGT